jgi:hypothetical protein
LSASFKVLDSGAAGIAGAIVDDPAAGGCWFKALVIRYQ